VAGDAKDKVQTIGKSGLKLEDKITDDDKHVAFTVDIGGKELQAKMQAKTFTVKMLAGKKYTLTMDTDDDNLDPFLVLQDPTGKTLGFDDDGGGMLNSKLSYTVKKDGNYKVLAAALKGTGAFRLKITESGGAAADPKKVHAVGKDGLKIEGALSQDTKQVTYQVKMTAGKTYRIDLKSRAFDCYLYLHDPNGKKLDEDDDGGDGLNSRITHKVEADGTYRIVASSLGMIGAGDFVLEVREEE
jgi:hypothetical protein